jgi:hypothetical protein
VTGSRPFTLALALAAALLAAATAALAGTGKEQIRLTAADQARARAALIRKSDLGSGWSGGPVKPDLSSSPTCSNYHPKQSDLVLTGAAASQFEKNGADVHTEIGVLKTAHMVALDWRRTVLAPGAIPCLRKHLASELAPARIDSFKRLPFPKLGSYSRAYRLVASVAVSGKRLRIVSDIVLVGRHRTEVSIAIGAPYAEKVAVAATDRRLAKLALSRVK